MIHYRLQFWSSAHESAMHCDLSPTDEVDNESLLEGFAKAGRYALLLHAFDQRDRDGPPTRPSANRPHGDMEYR
ncbi:hypothetical protein BH10PSE12_BH10PSE12_06240 [soil metagenome]